MRRRFVGLRRWVGTADGRKLFRFALASAVNVLLAEAILALAFGVLQWSARSANVLAAVVSAIPAYWLARHWVWGRSGRSHLLKEVVPFWGLALLGLALTTWVAGAAERVGSHSDRLGQTIIVSGMVFGAAAAFWVAKFLLLNGVLFADRRPPRMASAEDAPTEGDQPELPLDSADASRSRR